ERFWQARHPPRYAAYLTPSSPSFPHNSNPGQSLIFGLKVEFSMRDSALRDHLDRETTFLDRNHPVGSPRLFRHSRAWTVDSPGYQLSAETWTTRMQRADPAMVPIGSSTFGRIAACLPAARDRSRSLLGTRVRTLWPGIRE